MNINKKISTIFFLVVQACLLGQQKTKISKEPDCTHFRDKDYSDTLYTYLDENDQRMNHSIFWIKECTEFYSVATTSEKGKQTIKKLLPKPHHQLIGTTFNFDSLDYSMTTHQTANSYKGKKVVLMTCWQGCGGCIALGRDIKSLEKEYPNIVFVHLARPWKGLANYKEKYKMDDIILLPDKYDPTFMKVFGLLAPFSFFINENGTIKSLQTGFISYDFLKKSYIEKLQKL